MEITEELIKEIYDKSTKYLKAKHGLFVDYIKLENGYLEGCCGDSDTYEEYSIKLEELDLDLEALTKIREEEERIRQQRVKEQKEKAEKEEEARRKAYRKEQYLNLKKEFE